MHIDHQKAFRESINGRAWFEAVTQQWFIEGVKTATLTFTMPIAKTAEEAAANFHRIEGARAFAASLFNLTESPKPPAVDHKANLRR